MGPMAFLGEDLQEDAALGAAVDENATPAQSSATDSPWAGGPRPANAFINYVAGVSLEFHAAGCARRPHGLVNIT